MTIGLLVCDHIDLEYQKEFGDFPDLFMDLFPEAEFILYDVCKGKFPDTLDDCDVYMATGSRHSVYEDLDWIIQLKELIRRLYQEKKYFVGFCFGHQLIGEALGGKVEKSSQGWCIGVHSFDLITSAEWMQPPQDSFNLLMSCQDQIKILPQDAKVLAGNEKCPIAMLQVGGRMLGIQAHPEFSKEYVQLLMELRVDRIGKEQVEQGVQSLQKTIDQELIYHWILEFLKKRDPST